MMKSIPGVQTAEIEFNRRVLKIREVHLHEVPTWWWQRCCWLYGGWGRSAGQTAMRRIFQRAENLVRFTMLDHWGKSSMAPPDFPTGLCEEQSTETFVTEPYGEISGELSAALQLMSCALRCNVYVLNPDRSWWFPNSTIRIEFSICKPEQRCSHCLTQKEFREFAITLRREREAIEMRELGAQWTDDIT